MHVYSCCAVLCVVLAVMCICVLYKFLSLGPCSAARSGQAKLKMAKHRHWVWEATQSVYATWCKKSQSALREE
jgi:hypothetical protein